MQFKDNSIINCHKTWISLGIVSLLITYWCRINFNLHKIPCLVHVILKFKPLWRIEPWHNTNTATNFPQSCTNRAVPLTSGTKIGRHSNDPLESPRGLRKILDTPYKSHCLYLAEAFINKKQNRPWYPWDHIHCKDLKNTYVTWYRYASRLGV